ncbi:MAG: protein translocase subunit SecD [Candidatus Spechtbacterales bacterium]
MRFRIPKPSKRAKIFIYSFLIFGGAFVAANLDYPSYWNQSADWVNSKQDKVSLPKVERGYSLGLDLQGGIHLIYKADLSNIAEQDKNDAMASLRDAIERRVNFLGVSEPVVQVQKSGEERRLIIELAGVTDPETAIQQIGETPYLEFREFRPLDEQLAILRSAFPSDPTQPDQSITDDQLLSYCQSASSQVLLFVTYSTGQDPCFRPTELTGQYLDRAQVVSNPTTQQLEISLQFNKEGTEFFSAITERNVGSILAIYLDGTPVSLPVVNQKIPDGQAVISGSFTPDEARDLARNLNAGALPVPVELISQQRVGAALGAESLTNSVKAGITGFLAVLLFLIIVYRLSGLFAVLSLAVYAALLLLLIKFIPVTLTLAGVAGLILSIGMAVDANILVFERLREEIKEGGTDLSSMMDRAFARAWPSVRDGHVTTFITATILFWFSTSFVKGFALTLGLGVLVSLFSSMVATKFFIKMFLIKKLKDNKFLWTR